MRSVNQIILLGTAGKDAEVRSTSGGTAVASVSLATNDRYKDKSGEWKDSTTWHNLVFWAKLAEIAGQYVKKGSRIYVEGKLQTRSYEKDGQKKYVTEVVVGELILLDGKNESQSSTSSRTPRTDLASAQSNPEPDDNW